MEEVEVDEHSYTEVMELDIVETESEDTVSLGTQYNDRYTPALRDNAEDCSVGKRTPPGSPVTDWLIINEAGK